MGVQYHIIFTPKVSEEPFTTKRQDGNIIEIFVHLCQYKVWKLLKMMPDHHSHACVNRKTFEF